MVDPELKSSGKAVHGHTVELARQLLRDAILSGEFAPGSVMTQTKLAEVLDIGRTPLREAIRVVQDEGLLVSQPNRKVRVAGLDIDDLEELYVLRIVNEAAAVRTTVPRLTPEDMGELRALVSKMDYFAAEEDYARYWVPHRAFHMSLIAAQGGRSITLSAQLFDHSARYRQAYVVGEENAFELPDQEHHAILEAAISRDGERCARELVAHYARTISSVVEQLDPSAELPRFQTACAVALGVPDSKAAAGLWKRVRAQQRGSVADGGAAPTEDFMSEMPANERSA